MSLITIAEPLTVIHNCKPFIDITHISRDSDSTWKRHLKFSVPRVTVLAGHPGAQIDEVGTSLHNISILIELSNFTRTEKPKTD